MLKQSTTSPFKVMEEEAYHAFLEWPVWLVLREKELAGYLAANQSQTNARETHNAGAHRESREET